MSEPRMGTIDWSGPMDQVGGNVEVLRDIVGAYAEEIRENLSLLPETIEAGNWSEIRRRAHTVKGAMRMFGIQEAMRHGQALEDAAASESGDIPALMKALRESAEAALPELDAFIKTGKLPTS